MNLPSGKRYKPEYSQLPFGFIDNNSALSKIISTKGIEYLAVYIAIQDRMGNHTEEDFTLSRTELISEVQSTLRMYAVEDKEIGDMIDVLIDANIVDKVLYPNSITDKDEVRYTIPSVACALEDARSAWNTKSWNSQKIDKDSKSQLKKWQAQSDEVRKEIRVKTAYKKRLRQQLADSISAEQKDESKVYLAAIDDVEQDIARLYRKIHSLDNQITNYSKGGDGNEE